MESTLMRNESNDISPGETRKTFFLGWNASNRTDASVPRDSMYEGKVVLCSYRQLPASLTEEQINIIVLGNSNLYSFFLFRCYYYTIIFLQYYSSTLLSVHGWDRTGTFMRGGAFCELAMRERVGMSVDCFIDIRHVRRIPVLFQRNLIFSHFI